MMSRLAIMASVVALAAGGANCANTGQANPNLGPSALMDDVSDATMAKRKPTSSVPVSTIDLVVLDSTAEPHFGGHVTFDVRTDATAYPYVTLRCNQNGVKVYDHSRAMFLASLDGRTFTLGPNPLWQSGGADCTATLENWDEYSSRGKITALASTTFAVLP